MNLSFIRQRMRTLGPTWREAVYIWTRRPFLLFLIFLLTALALRMGVHPRPRGDGAEYFVMTRSLARDGNLVITPEEMAVFRHPDSPWPWVVLEPHTGPLVQGRDGLDRCVHSFIVPALVVPFYWLCAWIAPAGGSFHCYSVFGLWALLICWYLLSRYWQGKLDPGAATGHIYSASLRGPAFWGRSNPEHRAEERTGLLRPQEAGPRNDALNTYSPWQRWAVPALAFVVIFFTPLLIYSHWAHGEAGIFFLLCLFFYWLDRDRWIAAGLALGLAAAQNLAVGFWGVLLFYRLLVYWRDHRNAPDFQRDLARGFAALALIAALPFAYAAFNYYHYGTFSMLRRFGNCIPQLIGIERTLRFYWDPFFGLVWFFPWALLGLFSGPARRLVGIRFLLSLPIAAACMATSNLNSHMVGLRYLVFVYPAFLFVPMAIPRPWALRAGLAVCVGFCFWITWPFVGEQARAESFTRTIDNKAYVGMKLVFRLLPALYDPEPECFMENVVHTEVNHTETKRPHVFRARVNETCWFVLAEKTALPPGKAALIIQKRGGRDEIAAVPARFGVNSSLGLSAARLDPRGGNYRLEFTVRAGDFLTGSLRGDYLYLKFDHPSLKPVALELPDGQILPLLEY